MDDIASAVENNDRELKEYNEYLGVFGTMAFVLAGLSLLYIWRNLDLIILKDPIEAKFLLLALSGGILTVATSLYFSGNEHKWLLASLFQKNGMVVSLSEKKSWLIVSFVLYLFTLSLLTSWSGGALVSYFGNLLLLTASLSTYVAKQWWTKGFVSGATVAAYVGTSYFFYDRSTKEIHAGFPDGLDIFMHLIIALFVTGVSWYISDVTVIPNNDENSTAD